MADDLRLKVTQSEYQTRLGTLDSKIAALETIYQEYAALKMESHKVLGEGDSNLQQLMDSVEKNMKAVSGQHEMLVKSREMLEKQNEQIGIKSSEISQLLTQAQETAKTAFNTIKIIGDMVT